MPSGARHKTRMLLKPGNVACLRSAQILCQGVLAAEDLKLIIEYKLDTTPGLVHPVIIVSTQNHGFRPASEINSQCGLREVEPQEQPKRVNTYTFRSPVTIY